MPILSYDSLLEKGFARFHIDKTHNHIPNNFVISVAFAALINHLHEYTAFQQIFMRLFGEENKIHCERVHIEILAIKFRRFDPSKIFSMLLQEMWFIQVIRQWNLSEGHKINDMNSLDIPNDSDLAYMMSRLLAAQIIVHSENDKITVYGDGPNQIILFQVRWLNNSYECLIKQPILNENFRETVRENEDVLRRVKPEIKYYKPVSMSTFKRLPEDLKNHVFTFLEKEPLYLNKRFHEKAWINEIKSLSPVKDLDTQSKNEYLSLSVRLNIIYPLCLAGLSAYFSEDKIEDKYFQGLKIAKYIFSNDVKELNHLIQSKEPCDFNILIMDVISPLLLAKLLKHAEIADLLSQNHATLCPQRVSLLNYMREIFVTKDSPFNIEFAETISALPEFTTADDELIASVYLSGVKYNLPVEKTLNNLLKNRVAIANSIRANPGQHSAAVIDIMLNHQWNRSLFKDEKLFESGYKEVQTAVASPELLAPYFKYYPEFCKQVLEKKSADLLTIAMILNASDSVRFLISKGANLYQKDKTSCTPAHYLFYMFDPKNYSQYKKVRQLKRELLAKGALKSVLDDEGGTPFSRAVASGLYEDLDDFYRNNPGEIIKRDNEGNDGLHLAVKIQAKTSDEIIRKYLTIKKLLEFKQLDVNSRNMKKESSVYLALQFAKQVVCALPSSCHHLGFDIVHSLMKHPELKLIEQDSQNLLQVFGGANEKAYRSLLQTCLQRSDIFFISYAPYVQVSYLYAFPFFREIMLHPGSNMVRDEGIYQAALHSNPSIHESIEARQNIDNAELTLQKNHFATAKEELCFARKLDGECVDIYIRNCLNPTFKHLYSFKDNQMKELLTSPGVLNTAKPSQLLLLAKQLVMMKQEVLAEGLSRKAAQLAKTVEEINEAKESLTHFPRRSITDLNPLIESLRKTCRWSPTHWLNSSPAKQLLRALESQVKKQNDNLYGLLLHHYTELTINGVNAEYVQVLRQTLEKQPEVGLKHKL